MRRGRGKLLIGVALPSVLQGQERPGPNHGRCSLGNGAYISVAWSNVKYFYQTLKPVHRIFGRRTARKMPSRRTPHSVQPRGARECADMSVLEARGPREHERVRRPTLFRKSRWK